ncbi:MAG: UDP-glucose 4-epimerase [Frankiaceae bacterium]|nr:UDP-glucose 4-epimerase [Frankiaceae bacterium]
MSRPVAVVTGGAGFIGSHMVDLLLAEGFEVRVIDDLSGGRRENLEQLGDDPALTLEVADIRELEPDGPVFEGAKYVFHFAGIGDIVPSIERPLDYLAVNAQGTVRVLEAARAAGIERLVYAASSSCYGIADETPTTESAAISPEYPYALSKWQGEEAVLHWNKVYDLPTVSVRIFNAYGMRSRTTGAYGAVFGVFLAQKLAGKPFTVVGDGTQSRDFVNGRDVARAFYLAATKGRPGEVYNLGAGDPQPVNRLVELLGGEVVYVPKRPGEPDVTWADTTKIRTELGWEPLVSFEEGVGEMVANIDRWRDAPVWDPDSIAEATQTWFDALAVR